MSPVHRGRSVHDFPFYLGQLMGVMEGIDESGQHHPSLSKKEWDDLGEHLKEVAVKFYEEERKGKPDQGSSTKSGGLDD